MAEKKSLYRFTIGFNPGDPAHRQVAELLCRDAGVELWDLDALLEQFHEGASVPE